MATSSEVKLKNQLKWGIAGCNKRSQDFSRALAAIPDHRHFLLGVCSGRGTTVVNEFLGDIPWEPKVYKDFMDLACDQQIDIVYIGNLVSEHCMVACLMMRHRKHVVIEAPICVYPEELEELLSLSKRFDVMIMDCVTSLHVPAMADLRRNNTIEHEIGEISAIHLCIGRNMQLLRTEYNHQKHAMGAGFLFFPYFSYLLMDLFEEPPTIEDIDGVVDSDGVCTRVNGILNFGDSVVNFACYTSCASFNNMCIVGRYGYCKFDNILDGPTRIDVIISKNKNDLHCSALDSSQYFYKGSASLKYVIEKATVAINERNGEGNFVEYHHTRRSVDLVHEVHRRIRGIEIPPIVKTMPAPPKKVSIPVKKELTPTKREPSPAPEEPSPARREGP